MSPPGSHGAFLPATRKIVHSKAGRIFQKVGPRTSAVARLCQDKPLRAALNHGVYRRAAELVLPKVPQPC